MREKSVLFAVIIVLALFTIGVARAQQSDSSEVPSATPADETVAPANDTTTTSPTKQTPIIPEDPEKEYLEGIGLLKSGEFELAAATLEEVIQLKPGKSLAYLNLARAYLKMGRLDKALQNAEKAVIMMPTSSSAYNTLARVYALKKKYEKAIENYQTAIKLNPANSWAYNNLGLTYLYLKRDQDAVQTLEKAVALKSPKPLMYNNLGIAYTRTGNIDKARAAFQMALKLDPKFQKVERNLKALK